jgi:hypothetical protein
MSAREAAPAVGKKPRRSRWKKILLAFAMFAGGLLLAAWYLLQPERLTALILDRANRVLQVELQTSGPGSYALRPEPRLVLPGLTATIPGEHAPFFRSQRVELALPWATLRGKSTDISSVVLKSPDVDLTEMKRWIATLPPRTTPLKLPTLTRGMHVNDGVLRGSNWRIEHLDVSLPALADAKPATLDARGEFVRSTDTSKFHGLLAATPAGWGLGLRVDAAHIVLTADGAIPSLSANGDLRAANSFVVDLHGTLQRIPPQWAAAIDSTYANSHDTPFSIAAGSELAAPDLASALPLEPVRRHLHLHAELGDPKRQPALRLDSQADRNELLEAKLHGELSRWPDAWPALPAALSAGTAALVFDASYRGTALLEAPVAFDVRRADAVLQGNARIADLRAWMRDEHAGLLPPVEATLSLPQIESGGVQLRGVRTQIRDGDTPSKPAPAPKS